MYISDLKEFLTERKAVMTLKFRGLNITILFNPGFLTKPYVIVGESIKPTSVRDAEFTLFLHKIPNTDEFKQFIELIGLNYAYMFGKSANEEQLTKRPGTRITYSFTVEDDTIIYT
jgi:hypothetical protein